jgi:hypothetical protein
MVTGVSLGETTGAAQPFYEPLPRFCDGSRAIGQQVAQQEMARKVEPLRDLGPRGRAPFANESR